MMETNSSTRRTVSPIRTVTSGFDDRTLGARLAPRSPAYRPVLRAVPGSLRYAGYRRAFATGPPTPPLSVRRFVIRSRMASAISVRLDDEAERALRVLNACGMSTSDAIRSSLIESARRVRRSEALAREVAALEADEADRAEMLEVAGLMESLRAAR